MKTNLEIVRAACIRAVPEIMELKFGLPIVLPNGRKGILCTVGNKLHRWNIHLRGNAAAMNVDTEECEILGFPITLADVLRAVGEPKLAPITIDGNGTITLWKKNEGNTGVEVDKQADWNLALDLSDQSEPTLSFLAGILK